MFVICGSEVNVNVVRRLENYKDAALEGLCSGLDIILYSCPAI